MKMLSARMCALAFMAFASIGPAFAAEPLSENRYVNDRLVQARIADRIRRECPTISARMVSAYAQARALQRYARDLGHSDAEIDAFLASAPDRKRIYAAAEAYLKKHGAKAGQPDSFCRVGREEITKSSVAGSLLRAR